MSMVIRRLTNRVTVQQPGISRLDAQRAVDRCAQGPLPRALRSAVTGADEEFLCIRRLRVRVRVQGGALPSADVLATHWLRGIEDGLAIARGAGRLVPTAANRWGRDEVAIRFASLFDAQRAAVRAAAQSDAPWWVDHVRTASGLATMSPYEVLLHWATDTPERFESAALELATRASHLFETLSAPEVRAIWDAWTARLARRASGARGFAEPPAVRLAGPRCAVLAALLPESDEATPAAFLFARLCVREALPAVTARHAIEEVTQRVIAMRGGADTTSALTDRNRVLADVALEGRAVAGDDTPDNPLQLENHPTPELEPWPLRAAGLAYLTRPLLDLTDAALTPETASHFRSRLDSALHQILRRCAPQSHDFDALLRREGAWIRDWFGADCEQWGDAPTDEMTAVIDRLEETLPEGWHDPACEPHSRLRHLVERRGRLRDEHPFLWIVFPLTDVDIEVRRRGWDLDLGWVPELGRVLAFQYEEQT